MPKPERVIIPKIEIKCKHCNVGYLKTVKTIVRTYQKCSYCGWDSVGIYKYNITRKK